MKANSNNQGAGSMKVLVWNEYRHERENPGCC